MADRVHEHPEAGLSLGGHAASPERHDNTLGFVDVVNSDVEVELLWTLRIRPSRRTHFDTR
jgi:hypothetical protein